MKTLIKVIITWLLGRLFGKPTSVEDKIKLDRYKRETKHQDKTIELEENHATLEERTQQARRNYERNPTSIELRNKYIKLLNELRQQSKRIQRHDARKS